MRLGRYIILIMLLAVAAATARTPKTFIAEVLYAPDSNSPPQFIEFYNASAQNVSLAGWRLRLFTAAGYEEATLPAEAVIPAHGFYLVGREEDRGEWEPRSYPPDYYSNLIMDYPAAGAGVILKKANGDVSDAVGWGEAPLPFYEGKPHPLVAAGHSLERKSGPVHNEIRGNSYDTNDNNNDLRERATPEPQNINSPREYPSANTEENAWGRIKAMYYNQ